MFNFIGLDLILNLLKSIMHHCQANLSACSEHKRKKIKERKKRNQFGLSFGVANIKGQTIDFAFHSPPGLFSCTICIFFVFLQMMFHNS